MGWELFSLSRDSSNHWFKVIKWTFFGETSVYKREVVILFKVSSKSAITIESNPILPIVSFFF